MKITNSKKGVVHTWFDYVIAIVGGTVIFMIIFLAITSGTMRVEKEIKAKTSDIRSEEILVSYLSSPVGKGLVFKSMLSKEAYKAAKELAELETTFADLIVLIGTGDSEVFKEILQIETEYMLNLTLGKKAWKLDITYPSGNSLSYSTAEGKTKVYQLNLPSTGYQLTDIKLTAKIDLEK